MQISLRIIVLSCCFFVNVIFSALPNSGDVLAQEPLVIKMRGFRKDKTIDATKEYKYQLLELILNKTTETDGPFRIEVLEEIVQSRGIEMVNDGEFSLIITMTSQEREEKLLPVRIPVYKGFYGYRVFIINKQDKAKFELQIAKEKKFAEEMSKRLEGVVCKIAAKVSEEDRLYGSVSTRDIVDALAGQGIEIEKKMVLLNEPIKNIGTYKVPIRVYKEVEPEITVEVLPE